VAGCEQLKPLGTRASKMMEFVKAPPPRLWRQSFEEDIR